MAQYIRHTTVNSLIEAATWLEKWIKEGYTIEQFEMVPTTKTTYRMLALLYYPPATEDDFLPKRKNNVSAR